MKNKPFIFYLLICFISTVSVQQLQAQLPRIDSIFPAKGHIGGLMTITGRDMQYTAAVAIGTANELIISVEDTAVVIMVMPGTVTGYITITSFSGGHSLYAGNFTVRPSAPPNKQLGDKLYGKNTGNTVNAYQQGFSTAISANGNTAVVGGAGYVWVYVRNNNVWAQQGDTLIGTGATGSLNAAQGFSVAISADGNTFIEGGIGDDGFTGAAWIFTRDENGIWTQQGNKLVGTGSIVVNGTTPEQGYSVSISADGNTAVIGGRRDNNYIGAAWIFTRSNGVWTEQQKIIPTGYISYADHQGTPLYLGVDIGTSVAISADGNTALLGGPRDNNDTGAVWIYTRNGNTWLQQSKLVGTGGTRSFYGGIQQGTSAAISADGRTVIIGGPFDTEGVIDNNNNNNYGGAIWIFTRSNNTWNQQGNKLFATDASLGAEQGWSVSISADGNTAIVGAPTDSVYTGGAWIYTRNNNVWTQSSNKLLGTGYVGAAKEGWSANISADGNTAIIGGPEDYYQHQGASWVFADSNAIILPVTFANFKAYLFGKGVQTAWSGYNEINISSYDVEKSAHGHNFNKLANIPAKTNKALENNYAWFDASPFAGDNFYRIKAINKDGSAQYSSIIKLTTANAQSSIQVYPNPVHNKTIQLQLNNIDEGYYSLMVYDINGKYFYKSNFQYAGGSSSETINLSKTSSGIYYVELKNANHNYHTTLVLQ